MNHLTETPDWWSLPPSPKRKEKISQHTKSIAHALSSTKDLIIDFGKLTAKNFKNIRNADYLAQTTPEERQLSKVLDKTRLSLGKMPIEALIGRTLVGEKLTPLDRILYTLIALTNRFAYLGGALAVKEQNAQLGMRAGISYGISRGVYTLQRTPNLIRDLKEFAEKKNINKLHQFACLLEQIARKVGFEKLQKMQEYLNQKISSEKKE